MTGITVDTKICMMDTELKMVPRGESETEELREVATVMGPSSPDEMDHYMGGEYIKSISRKIRKDPLAIGKLFKEGKYPYRSKIQRASYTVENARVLSFEGRV